MKDGEENPQQITDRESGEANGGGTEPSGIRTVKYTAEKKEGLLELLIYMWKDLDPPGIKDRFRWRYENNPYLKEPCVYLALDGNSVVGFRAMVAQMFELGEKRYRIFSPADAIVHPDHRRKGVFSKLNEAMLEDVHGLYSNGSLILNLSSNKYSAPGNIKQGWREMNCLKVSSYRLSPWNCLMSGSRQGTQSSGSGTTTLTKGDCEIEITSELRPRELAGTVRLYRDVERLSNVRDEAFFEWRYSYQPEAYTFIHCRKGGGKGYMVLKKHSSTQYALMECAADTNMMKTMVRAAMKEMAIPIMRTWGLNDREKTTLRRCGFVTEPPRLLKLLGKRRLPPLVRPTVPVTEERDFLVEGRDVRDIGNWVIHLADVH